MTTASALDDHIVVASADAIAAFLKAYPHIGSETITARWDRGYWLFQQGRVRPALDGVRTAYLVRSHAPLRVRRIVEDEQPRRSDGSVEYLVTGLWRSPLTQFCDCGDASWRVNLCEHRLAAWLHHRYGPQQQESFPQPHLEHDATTVVRIGYHHVPLVERDARDRAVRRARGEGWSYRRIAREFNIAFSHVHAIVNNPSEGSELLPEWDDNDDNDNDNDIEQLVSQGPEELPPDTGCDLHPACLSCPLPQCRYDGGTREESQWRYVEQVAMIKRLKNEGLRAGEIAPRVGVSRRTVHRALAL